MMEKERHMFRKTVRLSNSLMEKARLCSARSETLDELLGPPLTATLTRRVWLSKNPNDEQDEHIRLRGRLLG